MRTSNSQHRIKEILEYFDISASDLSKRTGLAKSTLSCYMSGKRIPRQEQLAMISDPFNINPVWLMGYDVPMFNNAESNELAESLDKFKLTTELGNISNDEMKMIIAYRKADELTKQMIKKLLGV